jgi:hypothetical protein
MSSIRELKKKHYRKVRFLVIGSDVTFGYRSYDDPNKFSRCKDPKDFDKDLKKITYEQKRLLSRRYRTKKTIEVDHFKLKAHGINYKKRIYG